MALFVDVLVHPLDSAQADLDAMAQSVGVFQTVPVDALSRIEIRQIQMLNEFILELVQLAGCAIRKADGKTTARQDDNKHSTQSTRY